MSTEYPESGAASKRIVGVAVTHADHAAHGLPIGGGRIPEGSRLGIAELEGAWTPQDVAKALDARDRGACGPVAPPDGLYFVSVTYGPADTPDDN